MTELPDEIKELKADSRGRVNLGPDYADETVRVAVIETNHLSVSIECPGCGMPFDVPQSVNRWSCDCGESWEIEQTANAGESDS